ncbi:DNA-directed RNA polymerase subunit alpha [Silvanigrella paludirubra]|uniref:DNA-directed RNA polymerase subunit alpha n=2 Tax=Silvanigrella paludirubra TaxID=2499159 RepID=A0A6N6VSB0_9BACT|nr:DNA-directed RNA polymerase subunit alpha [Silvanigrella paludirubra]
MTESIMQSNWKALLKPQFIEKEDISSAFGRFIAKPLERGFGTTLGNALRRVLLSSLQGAAVVGLRIEGVEHEFSTVPDVSEDVTEVVLNLKALDVWLDTEGEKTAMIDVVGPKVVRGSDVISDGSLRILNPDHVICTVGAGGKFKAEITVRTGKGYLTSDAVKDGLPLGVIPIDAVFSPVKRVSFSVSDTRIGQRSDFNKLILEISTNGAVTSEDALAYAAKILKDQLSIFINFQEADDEVQVIDSIQVDARLNENLYKSVDELELSVRAANCLENAGIRYIGELVIRTEAEMLKTKNFGRKTLNEIKDLLAEMGLHLGMKIEGFDPTKLRDRI